MRPLWVAIGWALVAAIVWLSLTPSPPDLDFEQSDKLGHFAFYAATMFWFAQLYPRAPVRARYAAGFIALGIALELAQRALGYRSFDLLDMAADTTGVMLGWGVALFVPIRRLGVKAGRGFH